MQLNSKMPYKSWPSDMYIINKSYVRSAYTSEFNTIHPSSHQHQRQVFKEGTKESWAAPQILSSFGPKVFLCILFDFFFFFFSLFKEEMGNVLGGSSARLLDLNIACLGWDFGWISPQFPHL